MNVFIDFDIIKDSTIEDLKVEFAIMISQKMKIYIWHITTTPIEMAVWAATKGLAEYIWDYYAKTSFHYSKIDLIIDQDETLVNKFKARGILGNVLTKI